MPRAIQTAEIIKANTSFTKKIQTTNLLRECKPQQDLRRINKNAPIDKKMMAKSSKTLNKAFKEFFKSPSKSGTDVIVCHGNVIRYLFCKALGIDPKYWISLDILQCSLTIIEIDSSKKYPYLILSHNDTGHLPKQMKTFL